MANKGSILKDLQIQRGDIIEKLERIEEKQSTVSVEVYEKVRREYEEKLKNVEAEIGRHADLITSEIKELEKEAEKIRQSEKKIKFKIEEVELRYSIGEYDEDSYNKVKDENNEKLKQITEDQKRVQETIEWYSKLLTTEGVAEREGAEEKLEIEEHILEEKLPEEVALEELLTEEEALKPESKDEETGKRKKPQEKNITCPKCGYLNTPDSWYCEKCGAEILGMSESS